MAQNSGFQEIERTSKLLKKNTTCLELGRWYFLCFAEQVENLL